MKKDILALEGEVRTVMERIEVKFKLLDCEEQYLGLRDQVAQIISGTITLVLRFYKIAICPLMDSFV